MSISLKGPAETSAMREGGKILAEVLETIAAAAKPGVTPWELSTLTTKEVAKYPGAQAAFLGHQGFPAPICISVNQAIVHGIPSKTPLREGDIVGLDFGIRYKEMLTDGAITVPVGKISADARHLLKTTVEARKAGIAAARAGNRVGDISAAVERVLRGGKLGIIEDLVGHGVGYELWEEPQVSNVGDAHTGPRLKPGMTLAIEPMATLGGIDIVIDRHDGWTVCTADGSLAAQFEHTVLITPSGPPEILTTT